ncbi:MAG: hypothetical protein ISQ56_05885 [Pseudomonadales bacterium]|nr:hypothetical protein [Pseudomonadales bacterium]
MEILHWVHENVTRLHVAVGSCGLLLFWIPVVTRKGNLNHKKFGRYFAIVMYAVGFSGITVTTLDLLFPLAIHAPDIDLEPARAAAFSREVRDFALFLFSISLLVLLSTRHGWLTVQGKEDRRALREPIHLGLCAVLIVAGLGLSVNGLATGSILFVLFGVFEIYTSASCLYFALKPTTRAKEWWTEHLNGLIASGIAAYTAFFVFGGLNFLSDVFGDTVRGYSILLWVAPGVIGGIAIAYQTRKYRLLFERPTD